MKLVLMLAIVIALAASAFGSEMKAFQIREDYYTVPVYDCYTQYYYHIPCPTYSWYWAWTGFGSHETIGVFFTVGDPTMGLAGCAPGYSTCDAYNDHTIELFRVLDLAGYGTLYPGLFTVEFDIYCSDAEGRPVGPAKWSSGPVELCTAGWNYVPVSPNLTVTDCYTQPQLSYPRFLITATSVGSRGGYPAWAFDNVSKSVDYGCAMHDQGCCPALYPRPAVSHYSTIHTGYYGLNFEYCPPLWFLDGGDSVGNSTGHVELAWRVYLIRSGPDALVTATWGAIKSMYR